MRESMNPASFRGSMSDMEGPLKAASLPVLQFHPEHEINDS